MILASAAKRWGLYAQEYGLSEIRLYSLAFGVFVLAVYVGLGWLLWRNAHWKRLQLTVFTAFFVILASLNILNPDATIARYNQTIERPLDTNYLYSLSLDVLPELVEIEAGDEPPDKYCNTLRNFQNRLQKRTGLEKKLPDEEYLELVKEQLEQCRERDF